MQQTISKNIRDMELGQTNNKTKMLNSMVLRAWRERWTESQWGINIKTILPRGVSGDVYNLANCLLKQALVGSTANKLVLNLLKHSLCSQLVSHSAVLQHITTYDFFGRRACLSSLLQFLENIMDGITCRNKQEEQLLPNALLHLVKWLLYAFPALVEQQNNCMKTDFQVVEVKLYEQYCRVVQSFTENPFLLSLLYVARQDDSDLYEEICKQHAIVDDMLVTEDATMPNMPQLKENLKCLSSISLAHLKILPQLANTSEQTDVESITYIIQPLLAVDVLINPTKETVFFVHEMQTIQRLKNFSNERLFYEIIRAGLISLSNMAETSHDTMWGAFTFFKIPQIIRSLYVLSRNEDDESPNDHIPEVVKAFEMLMEDNLLLDRMDSKCACNIIEYILNDWTKHQLVTEAQCKNFASQREKSSSMLQKRDAKSTQTPSIINFIIRAEVPLNGILKTLGTDYNKVQEALLGVLCQVLVGNSFDLILSVATVEGRLRSFISRLIQCNENSMQVAGETGKQQAIRSTLFDVSFLMLTFITQTYGANILLSSNNYNGNSFFERWVRECMVERNKPKNPANIIDLCEEEKVDELLLTLSKSDAQTKNTLNWQDICMTLPAVLHHVLIAWEHEALSSADVKSILDNIKRRLFCYSVCATSYLCAYMYSVRQQEFLKPLNMIQQFLTPSTNEDLSPQDNVKERMALAFQIIRKMQHDVHPSGTYKPRSIALTQSLVSTTPLIDHFNEVWKNVSESGYISVRSAQMLESLLQAGGPVWLARHLVEQIIHCKYVRDMNKTMDIVFSTLHLDIMRCTSSLLEDVIPLLVQNRQGEDVNEPQLLVLANLCVYCIISCVEIQNAESAYGYVRNGVYYESRALAEKCSKNNSALMLPDTAKKRPRAAETDTENCARSGLTKTRKIGEELSNSSAADDFLAECLSTVSTDHLSKSTTHVEQRQMKSEEASLWNLHTEQCYSHEEDDNMNSSGSGNSSGLAEAIASVSGFLSSETSNKSLEEILLMETSIDRFNDNVDSLDCSSEINSTKDACSELVSMLEAVAEYEVKSVESAVAALSGACVLDDTKDVDLKDDTNFLKLKSDPDGLLPETDSKSDLLDIKKGILLDNVDIFMNKIDNSTTTTATTNALTMKDENDGIEKNDLIKIKQEQQTDNENNSDNNDMSNNLNENNANDNDDDHHEPNHQDELALMNEDNVDSNNNNNAANEFANDDNANNSNNNNNDNNNQLENNNGSNDNSQMNADNENSTNKLNDLINEDKTHNNDNDKSLLDNIDKLNEHENNNSNDNKISKNEDKIDNNEDDKLKDTTSNENNNNDNSNETHKDNENSNSNNEETKKLNDDEKKCNSNVINLNDKNLSENDKESNNINDNKEVDKKMDENKQDKDLEQKQDNEQKTMENVNKDNDNMKTQENHETKDKLTEQSKDNENNATANANELLLEAANSITHAISVDSGLGENVESIFGHVADLVDGANAFRVKDATSNKEETTALLEATEAELASVTTALGFDDLDTDGNKSKGLKTSALDGDHLDNLFNDNTSLSLTADTQDGVNFPSSDVVLDANTEVNKLLGVLENSKGTGDDTSISDLLRKEALTNSGIEDISEDAVDGMLGTVMDVSADLPVSIKSASNKENSSDNKKLDAIEHKSLDAIESCAALFSTETSVSAELNALDSTTALATDEISKLPLMSTSLDTKLSAANTENDALAQAFASTEGFNLDDEATFSGRLAALASLDVDESVGFSNTDFDCATNSSETEENTSGVSGNAKGNIKEGSSSKLSSSSTANQDSSTEAASTLSTSRIAVRSNIGDGSRLKAKRLGKYTYSLRDPLASSVHTLFKAFQHFVNTEDLSPKVYFVHQFITLLVEHGGERVRPVLNLLPPTIIPAMLKILLNNEISCGLIARLYDLDTLHGRQNTISDLCLWQNIKLKQDSTQM